ncbi:MAG: hypothetical protein EP305_10380 [Bacteroidetes bacterium]|nr:MAG: hypothetical protein EP305_10380 [Bacteroidota bacterium]
MKVVTVFIPFLLVFLFACTLNSEQEAELNESTQSYLAARQNGAILMYVSKTHPEVIRYYKSLGDSSFIKKFELSPSEFSISDASIEQIKKSDDEIHVLYTSQSVEHMFSSEVKDTFKFVAISTDNGQQWLYMDYSDYVDKSIAPSVKRLLLEN